MFFLTSAILSLNNMQFCYSDKLGIWVYFTYTNTKTLLDVVCLTVFKELLQYLKSVASVATKSFVCSTLSLIWDKKFLQVVLTSQTFHSDKDWNIFHTLEFGTIKHNHLDIEFYSFLNINPSCRTLFFVYVRKRSQTSGINFFHWKSNSEVINKIELRHLLSA